MVKIKTKRAAAKRFRVLKSGKIKRGRAFGAHILTKKKRNRKTANKKIDYVHASDVKKLKRCLPN